MTKGKKERSKKPEKELSKKMNDEDSAAFIYQFHSEIERGMEEFDMEKKIKTVKAIEDLGRIVITM
jgi:hypothetical protein